MVWNWLRDLRKYLVLSGAAVLAAAGVSRAADPGDAADLKAKVDEQQRRIDQLEAMIRSGALRPASADADDKKEAPKSLSEADVKKILGDYLKENPGVGMPSGVQVGLESNRGFVIRSAPDPKYVNWEDGSKIPFELRIRGRLQIPYYFYQPTDTINHQTGALANPVPLPGGGVKGGQSAPNFSQLEIKRMRLIFEGTAFDPNLRYHIQLDGGTRGLTGLANGNATGGTAGIPGGNGVVTVDHAMRLFSAYVAYDFHPCGYEKGCGPDCPDGTYRYTPTFTAIAGKMKPFFSFEEYLGSNNQQFVEYGMANWFFDADDDNLQTMAGFQIKAYDDRLYVQGMVTNGNETQIANLQMDDLPGLQLGGWYDFGGTWNDARKRWDLYGDSIADMDYSCKPVLRVGAALNYVPMDRRTLTNSQWGNAELNRVRLDADTPDGGGNLIGVLNGGGFNPSGTGVGQFAADAFDSASYEAFWSAHYKGFSIYNDWWMRDLYHFRGRREPAGTFPGNGLNGPILFTSGAGTSLFNVNSLTDFGMQLQGGYFIIPKKLELAGRWSWIRGDSGDINGTPGPNRTLTAAQARTLLGLPATVTPPTVHIIPDAFRHFHEADEYAVGVNYYFKRQLLKWQTDFSVYQGGNPAAGGQSPAGFIPGVDGWMVRSQIQLNF
jgi:hypothetical protein